MKLQIISDLHLEHHSHLSAKIVINSLDGNADVLVLAGDICQMNRPVLLDALQQWTDTYKHVVYVPGNHEYYGAKSTDSSVLFDIATKFSNLYLLMNEPCIIDKQKFFGGTMWFPFDKKNDRYKKWLNDFRLIKDFEPWCYEQNTIFSEKLASNVDKDTIVVSHHLPLQESISPRFRRGEEALLNCFFLSDQSKIISSIKPRLWFHGHTHTPCDYTFKDTHVICNPRGYPSERINGDFFKVVTI